jgi:hypothetical protein
MQILDFDGTTDVSDEDALSHRLRSVRHGRYGAFVLSGQNLYPCLFIHFNDELAYLSYFPSDRHPGFVPNGPPPVGCPDSVHFLQVDGSEADSIDVLASAVVTFGAACSAACEFLRLPTRPPTICTFEL